MSKKIKLLSKTLDNFILEHTININDFDHLTTDVQGVELGVLRSSIKFLKNCKTIYAKVSTEKLYKRDSKCNDIKKFLNNQNFCDTREQTNHNNIIF